MPTEFYYPVSSAGASLPYSNGLWAFTGGYNCNSALRTGGGRSGPATHDDDTSRGTGFSNGASTAYYSFNLDWPAPMAAYNGFLSVGYRHKIYQKDGTGSTVQTYLYISNPAGTFGGLCASRSGGPNTTAYANNGPNDISVAATYRPGGGSWAVADFGVGVSMFPRIGFHDTGGGGNLSRSAATSVWGQIAYTPPGGAMVFILGLVGLVALPIVGHFTDFQQFDRYLLRRQAHHPRHTVWAPGEKLEAWADVRMPIVLRRFTSWAQF